MKPTLIIATGPQGSGNHLFAKAFSATQDVKGWDSLKEKYWEGHDMEPFAECWKDPSLLKDFDWTQSKHFYTSISCPYFDDGAETIPNYKLFHQHASQYAKVKYLIIGRDQNILKHQQERVREKHTTPMFIDAMDFFDDKKVVYASQELLNLYGVRYLETLEDQLGIITMNHDISLLDDILKDDANTKYMHFVEYSPLDETIKLASSKKGAV